MENEEGEGDADASDSMNDILAQVSVQCQFYGFILYFYFRNDLKCHFGVVLLITLLKPESCLRFWRSFVDLRISPLHTKFHSPLSHSSELVSRAFHQFLVEKLQAECRKLEKKIVFRAEPWKYKKLMNECDDFLKLVDGLEALLSRGTAEELQKIVDHACSWQETATCFINRLMDEYAAYSDIIQPIQVAVYEMKFGLSLILSCTLEKKCLNTLGNENINVVMEMMYTLMRFPRAASCKFISVKHDIELDMCPAYSLESATGFCLVDMDLMERLVTLSSGVAADKGSVVQYRAAIYWSIFVQVAHRIANAKIIDDKSYLLLHKIFDEFARLWLSTKAYAKSKSDFDAQQYKFRPRAFQIESVIDVELPPLANSFVPETFYEWKEFSSEESSADKMVSSEECFTLDEEWKQLEESVLSHVVRIHNQIFGSSDLIQTPGIFEVSDEDRLHSFMESYSLGIDLIKGVHSINLLSLDAKLMPATILH